MLQTFFFGHRLVSRFMEGYNVTVLAYGQTSSGKSYTMGTDTSSSAAHRSNASSANSSPAMSNNSSSFNNSDEEERAGIIPRAVKQVFDEINRKTISENGRWKCETKTSYVEIYSKLGCSFVQRVFIAIVLIEDHR